jgi:transposase
LFLGESEIHLHPHLVRMWMPKGQCVQIPAPGKNHKVPIYGALNYRTNNVSYKVGSGKKAVEFLGFLAQRAQEYGGRPCVVALDNASYHAAVVVQKFLAELSTGYCPELNDIERIWKYVKGGSLANYDFGHVTNLRQAISEVFDEVKKSLESDYPRP